MTETSPTVQHGTLRQYVIGKCRCGECTAALRAYKNHTTRLKAYGQWEPLTDAEPCREHLRMLSEHGIGWRRAAQLAGVGAGSVNRLLRGEPGRQPSKRIRTETAVRLLAARPTLENQAACSVIDATGMRRRLQALVARGFPQKFIAARLGMDQANFSKLLYCERITAGTVRKVVALYEQLWDQDPAALGVGEQGRKYAKRVARKRDWVGPGAWDDATIDDPAAVPDLGGRTPRPIAVWEDFEFIVRTTGVEDRDVIAARLGISRDSLEKNLERARELTAGGTS